LLDVIQFLFTLFAFLAVLFHMCLLRLLDVVELLFTLVAFITKGKHYMELVRLTALAKALGLVHPVAKDGRGWNPQILSPRGKP